MKKRLLIVLFLLVTTIFIVGCSSEEPYKYEGEEMVTMEGRVLKLEDIPENSAGETVINHFLYAITGNFEGMLANLADTEPHVISVQNEKDSFKEGIYIKSYVIHNISTLKEKEYNEEKLGNGDRNPFYYQDWKEIVEEYKLVEYKIVNIEFTMNHSEKSNALVPQYGDGTYSRNFIVGKIDKDTTFKIYDFGMLESR
jgi:hypothetical protein